MKIKIPDKANTVLQKLNEKGYKAYVVGGCVRDSLLGRIPKDWDITTNATPEEMIAALVPYKTIPTGIQHGTITVLIDHEPFEVTTFRIEGKYKDNRRPEEVFFTKNIEEDLRRRDFTINAMAYNEKDGLIDPYKGCQDLIAKKIVAVGEREERFKEDALRILRGVRFATQLHFEIEEETYRAMYETRRGLKKISKERIRVELDKILITDHPSRGIRALVELELMGDIIPELLDAVGFEQKNPHHDKDVFNHTLAVLDTTASDLVVRLAALLHDIGKPRTFSVDEEGIGHFYGHERIGKDMVGKILRGLKYDNKTIHAVSTLVGEHMVVIPNPTPRAVKRFINRVGKENLNTFFDLQTADIKGTKEPHCFDHTIELKTAVEKILNEKQPLSTKDLAINGKDVMDLGVPQGKEIGAVLKDLLERVLEEPSLNERDKLIQIAKEHIKTL